MTEDLQISETARDAAVEGLHAVIEYLHSATAGYARLSEIIQRAMDKVVKGLPVKDDDLQKIAEKAAERTWDFLISQHGISEEQRRRQGNTGWRKCWGHHATLGRR